MYQQFKADTADSTRVVACKLHYLQSNSLAQFANLNEQFSGEGIREGESFNAQTKRIFTD